MTTAEINYRSRCWEIIHSEPLKKTIAEWQKDKENKQFKAKYSFSLN